ncbi:uncharacterized protein LOC112198707 [Rosa chinensis]|uniref:uncharacterized protein LOC112198707 n=1 Tax=Rosa chinensis TaxID=74649 RepID=UPI000D08A805|nr:uncharacterized protein LOC112198707 [Rosa chinensis]
MTPFEALYGYEPPSVIPYLPGSTSVAAVDQQLRNRDTLLAALKRNLQVAQSRMKGFYDKKHIEREFVVGDQVYLKLQPYRQHTVHKEEFHKLSQMYYGPFEVLERVGKVAYRLKLPPTARIHNVFHVSLLKKKLGDCVTVEPHLPPVSDPANPKWEPVAILDRRVFKKGGAASTQWLVQWLGTSPDEATWEDSADILLRFPRFDPEREINAASSTSGT